MNVVSRTARVSASLNGCSCPAWKNLDAGEERTGERPLTAAAEEGEAQRELEVDHAARRRSATMKIANTWAASRPV